MVLVQRDGNKSFTHIREDEQTASGARQFVRLDVVGSDLALVVHYLPLFVLALV